MSQRSPVLPPVNILIVDDHPENLVAMEAILEVLGQNIVRATSGREALRHLLSQEFAIILLDVAMPEMSGFETAELIRKREQTRHTPIIFLTAAFEYHNDDHAFQAYSVGAVDYLLKPIEPAILRAKVAVFVELFNKTEQVKRHSEVLSMLAHDLLNPLGNIMGYADLLLESFGDRKGERQAVQASRIYSNAFYMQELITSILLVSKIDSSQVKMQPSTVDLPTLLSDCINRNDFMAAEKQITIERDFPAEKLPVYVDRTKITQVVNNLVSNAIKFTPAQRRVIVAFRIEEEWVKVSITDEGQGIPAAEFDLLFRKFSQTSVKPAGRGTGSGLGLYIVDQLVKSHGGKVWVESEFGKGSTFGFALPRTAAASLA